jgi:A/G-specific adenine glycosylase
MSNSGRDTSPIEEFYPALTKQGLTSTTILLFQKIIRENYSKRGRMLPWRQTDNPYHILVSEIMLQQTPVSRVLKKYDEFITAFPDFTSLATAPLQSVLTKWQGLGYNRRAIALKQIAQEVLSDYGGELPSCPKTLQKLPGIGHYSASAISALAFNQPTIFIETNIRAVYIYFFFINKNVITDREIRPIVEATLDRDNPREWYYALFDYGAMLKKEEKLTERSAHYQQQAAYKGSNRELRGQILRLLLEHSPISLSELVDELEGNSMQVKNNLSALQKEGFLILKADTIYIA